MLLDGLEVFLDVCVMFWDSSNVQMAGVRRIYRPPSLVAATPMDSRKQQTTSRTDASALGSVGSTGHSQATGLAVGLSDMLQNHRFNR